MVRQSNARKNAAERLKQETSEVPASSSLVTHIDLGIADSLEHDDRFRERYLRRWASNEVATELRNMRVRRKLRQIELAEQTGTGQSAISRIEKQDYDGWTFKTLLNIANALKARLDIRLTPLEDIIAQHRERARLDAATSSDGEFFEGVAGTGPAHVAHVVFATEAALARGGDSSQDYDRIN